MTRGQKKGFKHSDETKLTISNTLKGIQPRYPGFLIKTPCEVCGLELNPPNMARHLPKCTENVKYRHLFPAHYTVRQIKHFFGEKRRKFGLSREEYASLYLSQGGCCKICGVEAKDKLVVDHCHKTGKVRALLCSLCNAGIGLFYENINTMKAAIKYLED